MYSEADLKLARELVIKHATLVKKIAHHLKGRLPASVQVDDLVQAGMIGLLEAAKNFDDSKGASFETYAGIRIRGSMLDEIRKGDWVPRSVHRNNRMIIKAISKMENSGSELSDQEIANELNISLSKYHKMLLDSSSSKIFALEDLASVDGVVPEGVCGYFPNPQDGVQKQFFKQKLADCIANLPERERLVLALYYDEELNLREVGEVMGISESRVSQIHSQAMLRLQAMMSDWRQAEG